MKDKKQKYSLDELLAGVTKDNIHAEVRMSPAGSDLKTHFASLSDKELATIADEIFAVLDRREAEDNQHIMREGMKR